MNKTVRITLITIGSLIVAVSLFFVIGFWPGSTKNVVAVANQFQPGSGWKLESERISPPRLICLQADCGEVRRAWTSSAISRDVRGELKSLVSSFTTESTFEDNIVCKDSDVNPHCEISVQKNGFPVVISLDTQGILDRPTLIFQVNPKET